MCTIPETSKFVHVSRSCIDPITQSHTILDYFQFHLSYSGSQESNLKNYTFNWDLISKLALRNLSKYPRRTFHMLIKIISNNDYIVQDTQNRFAKVPSQVLFHKSHKMSNGIIVNCQMVSKKENALFFVAYGLTRTLPITAC